MSAYLCDQHTINAIATYAADHGIVEDAALFADLLTCMNVLALRTRYHGRDFLPDMVGPAKVYRFERVKESAARVDKLVREYDYQACEADDYDVSPFCKLIDRIRVHAQALAQLERPGGCGAMRTYLSDQHLEKGIDGYLALAAELLTITRDVKARQTTFLTERGMTWDQARALSPKAKAALQAAWIDSIAELERPGGCGAQRLGIYWTTKSSNRKTGPMPVSTTSAETCPSACPLAKGGCYAKTGNVGMLWHALTRHGPNASWQHGATVVRSIDWPQLCERVAGLAEGTLWRHNQAGDLPHRKQRILKGKLVALVNANKGKRGFTYTHHVMSAWNRALVRWANATGFTINLSANTLAHADELAKSGPVVVVQAFSAPRQDVTPAGRVVRTCPATYAAVTCKQCQWCALPKRSWIVGFPAHGSGARAAGAIAAG